MVGDDRTEMHFYTLQGSQLVSIPRGGWCPVRVFHPIIDLIEFKIYGTKCRIAVCSTEAKNISSP